MHSFARLSLATVVALGAAVAQEDYADDWSGHKNVVVNTTAEGAGIFGEVTDFPVLVRLDSTASDIFAEAKEDGSDLRFTKADDETRLHHEIEMWDSEGQSAAVWVRVDTIRGNRNNQIFRMHWGNASADDSSNGAAVFDTAAGFGAVWHMNDTGDAADVTPNGLTAVANGSPGSDAGMIGDARSFDGSSSYFDIPGSDTALHFPAFGNYTISAWVKPNAVTGDAALFSKGDNAYALKFYRESSYEFFDFQGSWVNSTSTTPPTADTWVHLFAVNDETAPKLYVNGVLENQTNGMEGSGARIDDWNVNIGREPEASGGRRYFNGVIDEMRVHGVTRGADWARLEYQNQRMGQTTVTLQDTVPALDTTAAPGAPTAVTAVLGSFSGQATVSWTAPEDDGGSVVTGYRAVAVSDSTKFCATTGGTTCTVSGLTMDSTYSFMVYASNLVGMGPASEPSDTLTIPVALRGGALVIHATGNRNPFVFRLPSGLSESTESLTLSVIDAWGRTVWSRTVNPSRENVSRIAWNGTTSTGKQAAAGMYVVRVRYTERGQVTQRDLRGVTLAPR